MRFCQFCLDMDKYYRPYVSLTCIAFPRTDADADDLRIVHRATALFLRTETLIDLSIPHLPFALRLQSAHDS